MSSLFDNLTDLLVVGAFPAAILFAVYKFWTSGQVRIPNPKLGLMNLGGEEFTAILNEDRATFGSLFDIVVVAPTEASLNAMFCSCTPTLYQVDQLLALLNPLCAMLRRVPEPHY
jgi:hypothetical protein